MSDGSNDEPIEENPTQRAFGYLKTILNEKESSHDSILVELNQNENFLELKRERNNPEELELDIIKMLSEVSSKLIQNKLAVERYDVDDCFAHTAQLLDTFQFPDHIESHLYQMQQMMFEKYRQQSLIAFRQEIEQIARASSLRDAKNNEVHLSSLSENFIIDSLKKVANLLNSEPSAAAGEILPESEEGQHSPDLETHQGVHRTSEEASHQENVNLTGLIDFFSFCWSYSVYLISNLPLKN